jgi:cytochrome P450
VKSELFEEKLATFDLFDPDLQGADLALFFEWIRENHPVARTTAIGGVWLVSRYEDMLHIYHHPELFSNRAVVWPFEESHALPLNLDPPDHAAYRRLLAPMFSPQSAQRMEASIRDAAQDLINAIRTKGSCEAVAQFARPLPARSFLESFAIAQDRLPEMIELAESAFRLPEDEAGYERLHRNQELIDGYFHELVRHRREHPGGADIVSLLGAASIEDQLLSEDEIVNMLNLLLAASLDTTASALSNMLTFLAEHPDRRDELVDHPEIIPGAVEEMLRYEPMLFNGRLVVQDTEVQGIQMRKGDRVMMIFPAAMRDPRIFADPELVDFTREANRHLAFGIGPHRCLGLHLARLTLRVALEEWLRAFPEFRVLSGTQPHRRLTMVMAVDRVELDVTHSRSHS